MIEPAREAFTQGLEVAATVSGVLIVAVAVLVAKLLQHENAEQPATAPVALAADQPCG